MAAQRRTGLKKEHVRDGDPVPRDSVCEGSRVACHEMSENRREGKWEGRSGQTKNETELKDMQKGKGRGIWAAKFTRIEKFRKAVAARFELERKKPINFLRPTFEGPNWENIALGAAILEIK